MIIGPVLLGFWASIAFTAFIFIGPLGLWTFIVMVFRILDSRFMSYLMFRILFYIMEFMRGCGLSNIYIWIFKIFVFIEVFLLFRK